MDILDTRLYQKKEGFLLTTSKKEMINREKIDEMKDCCEESLINIGKKCCKKKMNENTVQTGLSKVIRIN